MTVIAAASLLDGVLLMADCRVTVQRRGRAPLHCDIAQKIFPLSDTMAIAFSGDVAAAAMLLPTLRRHVRRRRRRNAVSLMQWMPRFFKETYRRMQAKPPGGRPYGPIQFIVAATIPDRANVVDRARVAGIVKKAASPDASLQKNWMPDRVMQVLLAPAGQTRVPIPGAPATVVGALRSPAFNLESHPPLSFVALGSGGGAIVTMERMDDWLLTADGDLMAKMGMEMALQDFIAQNDIASVGGMFPCLKLDNRGIGFLGSKTQFPLFELALSVDPKTFRWTQENITAGKSRTLLYPEEIMKSLPTASLRFDDYRQAAEDFNPRRGKRLNSY